MIFSRLFSKRQTGFTLIELLVVISIIGLLSSIVLASVSVARARARDAIRLSDLHQLQIALEMYYTDNGAYPPTFIVNHTPVFWFGWAGCLGEGGPGSGYEYKPAGYIPGLVSKYISKLPEDPAKSTGPNPRCYAYASNGTDYMIMATNSEGYNPPVNLQRIIDYPTNTSIAIFTSGAARW